MIAIALDDEPLALEVLKKLCSSNADVNLVRTFTSPMEASAFLKENNENIIGVDVGIKEFYTDSNGNVVSNPRYLEKSMKKLTREQRRMSRKQNGSNNRNKQRIKVALIHEKITNKRNDFLQKQSTILICENQT